MNKLNAVPLVATRWLIDLLLSRQVSISEICTCLNMPSTAKEQQLYKLPLKDYLKVLNWAAERFSDDHFGLTTADHIQSDSFGPVLYLSLNTATLRELFQSIDQFDTLISPGLNINFIEEPLTSRLEYKLILPCEENPRHDIEQSLLMIVNIFRRYIDDQWQPLRINATYPKPENTERAIQAFGQEVFYEQSTNSLSFDTELLDTQITDADPQLLALLRDQIKKHLDGLHRYNNLISEVRYWIALMISSDACDSESIAKQLYMSRRSMVRHLTASSTSFRAIKDDVIEEMAKNALSQTNSSVSAIAHQLGFSETSAFDRTFKKLTGYTPRQYRQKSQTH